MDNIPLFRRKWRVQIDQLVVEELRVEFKIVKDIKKDPNTCHVKVYNLSRETRAKLDVGDTDVLILEAGYQDIIETVFIGDVHRTESYKEDTEWVTEFHLGDGIKAARSKNISKSINNGDAQQALRELLNALGKGTGNLDQAISTLTATGTLKVGAPKYVFSGNVAAQIDKVSKDLGLSFSMQDGKPNFVQQGTLIDHDVVLLTPDTGLIGSPELTKKGQLKVTAVIQQKLIPGKAVMIKSQQVDGVFQIQKAEFEGDTHGDKWQVELQCIQLDQPVATGTLTFRTPGAT